MLQRKWLIGGAALALLGIAVLVRGLWTTDGVAARTQAQARPVPVETATAERKSMPVQLRALGTVTPIAAVAINEMIGPVLFKLALDRSGESDRSEPAARPSLPPPAPVH